MTFHKTRMTIALGSVALALGGCDQGAGGEAALAPSPGAAAGAQTVIRDVERPDIFSVTENGLWDGRPSLGGVWVAHPDVKEPERAIITNQSNGQSVDGALFRRERENPGPRIQVSSDAADALDLLAGQPTELSILVVRQEEVEIAPPPVTEIDPVDAEPVDEAPAADVALTAAAIETAGVAATGAVEEVPGVIETVSEDELRPARRGFWGRFRDSLRGDPAPAAGDAGEPLSAIDMNAGADAAPAPEVETAPLDPVTSAAAAAIEAAEAAPAPAPEPLDDAYVQVGLFSVEENASAASAALRKSGIVPTVSTTRRNGKTFWRVVVGPASTPGDRNAILDTARDLGYADAFITDS